MTFIGFFGSARRDNEDLDRRVRIVVPATGDTDPDCGGIAAAQPVLLAVEREHDIPIEYQGDLLFVVGIGTFSAAPARLDRYD